MHRAVLLLILASAASAKSPVVEVRNSEVWLTVDGVSQQLTRDGKAKELVSMSPGEQRIVYIEPCTAADGCAPLVVVVDRKGGRVGSFHPEVQGGPCLSILSMAWAGEGVIATECHLNPSLSEYVETNILTGRHERDLHGIWFTRSPDGSGVAHVGWIMHFAPPYAQSYYLQVDSTTIYPLPRGAKPLKQEGLTERRDVVTMRGETYAGIHEFGRQLVWSPDSHRIALIDCTYDWTPISSSALSAADGKQSASRCSLAAVAVTGEFQRFPLMGVPDVDLSKADIAWAGNHRVSVAAGSRRRTYIVR